MTPFRTGSPPAGSNNRRGLPAPPAVGAAGGVVGGGGGGRGGARLGLPPDPALTPWEYAFFAPMSSGAEGRQAAAQTLPAAETTPGEGPPTGCRRGLLAGFVP